jgi:hypothetical protein
MRTACVLLSLCLSASAFAADDDDSVEMNVGVTPTGLDVKLRGPSKSPGRAPAPRPAAPPPMQPTSEGFQVSFEYMQPSYNLRVVDPEGATCELFTDDGDSEGTRTVPFNFQGRSGHFYRLRMTLGGSVVFDKNVELKEFKTTLIKASRPSAPVAEAAPSPVPAAAPVNAPAPAAPPALTAMPGPAFESLLSAMKKESFSDGKLRVLRSAVTRSAFTVAQVGRMVELLDQSSDKVKVVELTRARLVDRENGFGLYEKFTFDSDKEKVKELLGD